MKVAVLGAGAGGAASVAELVQAGHEVRLWARSPKTLAPHLALGGVAYEGKLGVGVARPALMTNDLPAATSGADISVVALPTFSHTAIARALATVDWPLDRPVLLNPGHTGGALEFVETFLRTAGDAPPVVEFSTLTYVARRYRPDGVTITGRAKEVKAAVLGRGEGWIDVAATLYPGVKQVADVLASDLSNVNMVLHPPGAVLAAAWVEATGGEFTFYVEAMTPE